MAGGSNYDSLRVAPTVKSGGAVSFVDSRMDNSVGKTLSAVSAAANDFNAELYEQANKIRVQAAINDYATDMSDWLYNADTGLMNRKGKDVAAPKSGEAFGVEAKRGMEERLQKYFGGLSPSQQKIAREFVDRERINRNADFLRHESREIQSYGNEVLETAVKISAKNIAKGGWNPELLTTELGNIDAKFLERAKLNGESEEKALNDALEFKTKTIQDLADILVGNDNLDGARQLLERYGQTLALNSSRYRHAVKVKENERRIEQERRLRMAEHRQRIALLEQERRERAHAKEVKDRIDDRGAALYDDVRARSSTEYQMGMQALNNYGASMTGDFKKHYDEATTEADRVNAVREWVMNAQVEAKGDPFKTAEILLKGQDGTTDTAKAEAFAKYFDQVLPARPMTDSEVREFAKERFKDADENELNGIIASMEKHGKAYDARAAVARNDAMIKAVEAAMAGKDIESISTSGLSAGDITRLKGLIEKRAKGDWDSDNEDLYYDLYQHPERLATMPRGELWMYKNELSAQSWGSLHARWVALGSGGESGSGVGTADPKFKLQLDIEKDIKDEFDRYLNENYKELLSKDKREQYNDALYRTTRYAMQMWRENVRPDGSRPTPEQLRGMVAGAARRMSFFRDGDLLYGVKDLPISDSDELDYLLRSIVRRADNNTDPSDAQMRSALRGLLGDGAHGRYADAIDPNEVVLALPTLWLEKRGLVEYRESEQVLVPTKKLKGSPYTYVTEFISDLKKYGIDSGGLPPEDRAKGDSYADKMNRNGRRIRVKQSALPAGWKDPHVAPKKFTDDFRASGTRFNLPR